MFENRRIKVTRTTRILSFHRSKKNFSLDEESRSIIRSQEEIIAPKSERTVKEWKEKRFYIKRRYFDSYVATTANNIIYECKPSSVRRKRNLNYICTIGVLETKAERRGENVIGA